MVIEVGKEGLSGGGLRHTLYNFEVLQNLLISTPVRYTEGVCRHHTRHRRFERVLGWDGGGLSFAGPHPVPKVGSSICECV